MALVKQHLSLTEAIGRFLEDLAHAGRSPHTRRAYATDLKQFVAAYDKPLADITTDDLRYFFRQHAHLKEASRARKQNSLASFLNWAYKHELVNANPMARVDRIRPEGTGPRGISRAEVERILAHIPDAALRDKLLFRLLLETGLRVGEALSLHIQDLDLRLDDEHLTVIGKGGRRRTVLLDDSRLVALLRHYLKQTGYQYGYLFRAHKNAQGGPIRYQSVHRQWQKYCKAAGIVCTIHQLRHAHATELVNEGVSLTTIRKRLGHQNLQTTLRYAEQSDTIADDEIRQWRRRKESQ
ncbi:MAG: tyrosine-type recombinase/integrase [Chloroflexi bacterium]|nr:tyrosine-type recombinase/integrase [Chloroflexota bacterium]MCI0731840.1 tyrosine-type recombinase/integrase [Chloroflexota bacterium]